MTARTTPPFRADHVGSLLRPPRCSRPAAARAPARSPTSSCAQSRTRAIAAVVRLQEEVGLQSATDGEFRRTSWHMDFIYQLGGIGPDASEKLHGPLPQRAGRARLPVARPCEVHDRVTPAGDDLRRRVLVPARRRVTDGRARS